MLRTLVATGELPPVEERLPEVPYIMDILEGVGQYGGTLRGIRPSPDRDADTSLTTNETLVKSFPVELIAPRKYKGNVVESCEANEDFKVFTLHLRKGMKWSDGHPLTSKDFLFAYEDVLLNENLTPVFPKKFMVGDEPMKLEVIDDYTVRISFIEPYGGFPYAMAYWQDNYDVILLPKHYLKQFHPRYTSMEELKPLIEKEGLAKDEWWTLFQKKNGWEAVGKSTLRAWVVVEKKLEKVYYERNPYYFKVDPAGNQLPYIDRRQSTVVTDPQVGLMKMIAGEVDFCYETVQVNDIPILKENEKEGGYRTLVYGTDVVWVAPLNLTYPDPVWRQVVRDIRFRKALSMSINYEEVLDALTLGIGKFSGLTPSVYDPEKANQLLDEMDMSKRDKEGWRLGPDGKRFVIAFEVAPLWGFEGPASELLVEYFKAVGIYTTTRVIEFALWMTRGQSNEVKATIHWAIFPYWKMDPVGHYCYMPDWARGWGVAWRDWYDSKGKKGEEPLKEVKRLFQLRDVIVQTVSEEKRANAIDEIIRSYYDNIWMIGLVWPPRGAVIAANLGNFPPTNRQDLVWLSMEQYFFKR
jgi:peptide/nickel transport system substrate-binding protein